MDLLPSAVERVTCDRPIENVRFLKRMVGTDPAECVLKCRVHGEENVKIACKRCFATESADGLLLNSVFSVAVLF